MTKNFTLTLLFAALSLTTLQAKQRTEAQLKQIALKALTKHTSSTGTNSSKQAAQSATAAILSKMDSRSAISVYGAKGQGFVVLSNDDRFMAVLGESAHDYDAVNMPCGLKWWMDAMDASLTTRMSQASSEVSATGYQPQADYGPLLKTEWGQTEPYNLNCPYNINDSLCYTGCVATAAAQVMYYFKYPQHEVEGGNTVGLYNGISKTTTYQYATFKYTFDFDNMLTSYSGNYTDEQANAVAELMAAAGIAVKMRYSAVNGIGSAAYTIDQAAAMANNFDYDSLSILLMHRAYFSDSQWMQTIEKELKNNRPILYSGGNAKSAHAFVIDGMRKEDGKVHVNWGWSGYEDEYYDISYLVPDKNHDYRFNQDMNIGFDTHTTYEKQYNTTNNQPTHSSVICLENCEVGTSTDETYNGLPYIKTSRLNNKNWRYFTGTVNVMVKNEQGETMLDSVFVKTQDLAYGWGYDESGLKPMYLIPEGQNWPAGKYKVYFVAYPEEAPTTVNPVYIREKGWIYYTLNIKEDKEGNKTYSFGDDDDTSAIHSVNASTADDSTAETRYFDLSGRQLSAPQHGINIVKQGNVTRKIVVK